jgi:hypothetical protein
MALGLDSMPPNRAMPGNVEWPEGERCSWPQKINGALGHETIDSVGFWVMGFS